MAAAALGLTVQLPKFEGPLSLLLYLIRKEEMDIFDIKINEITGQYLEYIKLMKELDLEVAGEFISMAATLIHIKSRMLLPQYDENGEVVENEDPRKELVQRLLEYQKYQEAAHSLYERPLLGRDWWVRGLREKFEEKEGEILLEENALFSLISAYRMALRGAKRKIHQVAVRLQSVASRILEIRDRLIVGRKVPLSELIEKKRDARKGQVLITFLSVLELGKMGLVRLFQAQVYQEIYIEATREIDSASLSRVEEYENVDAPEKVRALMEEAPEDFVMSEELSEASALNDEIAEESFGFSEGEIASDEEILQAEIELGES